MRISARSAALGTPTSISRSKRPARRSARSMPCRRFVAPRTMTFRLLFFAHAQGHILILQRKSHFFAPSKISITSTLPPDSVAPSPPNLASQIKICKKNSKNFDEFLLKYWGLSVAKACKSCRSRQELSNEYFLAKFGVDTEENEPYKVCLFGRKIRERFDIEPFN